MNHPFKVGDKVWVSFGNEYHKGKLVSNPKGDIWLVRVYTGWLGSLGVHSYRESQIFKRN